MIDATNPASIDSVLRETRIFSPPPAFVDAASIPGRAQYDALYRRSVDDPAGFWAEMARRLRWSTPWSRVLEWRAPFAEWFVGGTLNVADNCLGRPLDGPRRNKAALMWIGEPPGETPALTHPAPPPRGPPLLNRPQ